MNVNSATMQVDAWKARTEYLRYHELVKAGRASQDDLALRNACREISRGEKVIDLNLAMGNAGLHLEGRHHGLPKLALARADWSFVWTWWSVNRGGRFVFANRAKRWGRAGDRQESHNVAVRFAPLAGVNMSGLGGKAQVPLIPIRHKPRGADLSRYRLLFEAEWARVPPVDPLLLRHIGGPFYVVLAQWDLSPLEQAVLRDKL